jgi:hypothetical protein
MHIREVQVTCTTDQHQQNCEHIMMKSRKEVSALASVSVELD